MNRYQQAYESHRDAAHDALALLRSYCPIPLPRVPGMDTVIRLAHRIACGATIEQAAAREYVYRWHLAVKPFDQVDCSNCIDPAVSIFGAPHPFGL